MNKLSVVIVNYNVKFFLEQALISVRKAAKRLTELDHSYETEVFVVDNNSVDGSIGMIQEKFPEVTLIQNKDNVGFARANNQAIQEATGQYILLLNPDTVVEEDTFYKVIDFMDQHPDAGGLGVKMLDGKGKFLPESKRSFPSPEVAFYKAFGLANLFPKSEIFGKYHLGYLDEDQTHEVDVLAGAFMLVRAAAINQVGDLDEKFFMYGEDIDFSYRIKKAGYKNYYYPETRIIHYKGESTKKHSVNYVFVFYKAMVIFAKKHFSKQKAFLLSAFLNFAIYFRALLSVFKRLLKRLLLPAMDFTLMYACLFVIFKFLASIDFLRYEEQLFYQFQLPVGVFMWLVANYFAFNYHADYRVSRLIKGAIYGTLTLLALYAFIPDDVRPRRMIVWSGAVIGMGVFAFNRLLLHYYNFRNFYLGNKGIKRILIIGNPEEAGRVKQLMDESHVNYSLVGFVNPYEEHNGQQSYLGQLRQLDEITEIYDVDEMIFCARDVPANQIINWMVRLQEKSIEYKIAPEESLFIIGSHSKNQPGDFYAVQIELALSEYEHKFNKRVLDIAASLAFLVTLPLSLWFVKRKAKFVQNILEVVVGIKTWVGYAEAEDTKSLPHLRRGVLNTAENFDTHDLNTNALYRINFQYARDYGLTKDIKIMANNFSKLGKTA